MKYVLIFLLVLVIFIISVTFGAHNDQVMTFNYFLAQSQFWVSTLLTSLFAAGFVICWVICGLFWAAHARSANARRAQSQTARTAACAGGDGSPVPASNPSRCA